MTLAELISTGNDRKSNVTKINKKKFLFYLEIVLPLQNEKQH
jgi:hypothetical protein